MAQRGVRWLSRFGGLAVLIVTLTGFFPALSTAQLVFTEFPIPTPGSGSSAITRGPDGNVWFVEEGGNKIGRITPGGTIAEFNVPTVPGTPVAIATGPDGNLWFTEYNGNKIGRITPAGGITE